MAQGPTSPSTWKRAERKVAEFLQTRRTPLSGGNSGHTRSDTLHAKIFAEVKLRKQFTLIDAWDRLDASKGVPVLYVREKDNKDDIWQLWHSADTSRLFEEKTTDTLTRKRLGVVNLWKDTQEKAAIESKLPIVALIVKYRPGFWIFCRCSDVDSFLSHI